MKSDGVETPIVTAASEMLSKIKAAIKNREAILAASEERQQKIAASTAELAEREANVNPDNLDEYGGVLARREQLARMQAKHATQTAEETRLAEGILQDAIDDAEVSKLFNLIRADVLARVQAGLKRFFDSSSSALSITYMAERTDSMLTVNRQCHYWCGRDYTLAKASEFVALLEGLVSGCEPWIFD